MLLRALHTHTHWACYAILIKAKLLDAQNRTAENVNRDAEKGLAVWQNIRKRKNQCVSMYVRDEGVIRVSMAGEWKL